MPWGERTEIQIAEVFIGFDFWESGIGNRIDRDLTILLERIGMVKDKSRTSFESLDLFATAGIAGNNDNFRGFFGLKFDTFTRTF